MQNKLFGHQAVSRRLSKKLQDWYNVLVTVNHYLDTSDIIINDLTFTISRCKQFDSNNGQFSLIHNSKLIECTEMYKLVNKSSKNK